MSHILDLIFKVLFLSLSLSFPHPNFIICFYFLSFLHHKYDQEKMFQMCFRSKNPYRKFEEGVKCAHRAISTRTFQHFPALQCQIPPPSCYGDSNALDGCVRNPCAAASPLANSLTTGRIQKYKVHLFSWLRRTPWVFWNYGGKATKIWENRGGGVGLGQWTREKVMFPYSHSWRDKWLIIY